MSRKDSCQKGEKCRPVKFTHDVYHEKKKSSMFRKKEEKGRRMKMEKGTAYTLRNVKDTLLEPLRIKLSSTLSTCITNSISPSSLINLMVPLTN